MSPWEFWIEFDMRADHARKSRRAEVGGKSVPVDALEEARAKARQLYRAKREKAQEAAE
jgi:hypothetical protein